MHQHTAKPAAPSADAPGGAGGAARPAAPVAAPQEGLGPPPAEYLLPIAHDAPPGSPAREAAADAASQAPDPGVGVRRPTPAVPGRPGGRPLGSERPALEAALGADLSSVRVHHAPHLVGAVGASAYARGTDIVTGGPIPPRVLAHEAAHVVQQGRAGRTAVERYPDPTQSTLHGPALALWPDADVLDALEVLVDWLGVQPVDPGLTEAAHGNLGVLLDQVAARQLTVPTAVLQRLPTVPASRLDPATEAALTGRVAVLIAMVTDGFPADAPSVVPQLEAESRRFGWLDETGAADALLELEGAIAAVEVVARLYELAIDPGGDPDLSARITGVRTAIRTLLDALLTPERAARITDVETARDAWLTTLVERFRSAGTGARAEIASPIDDLGYGQFSRGLPYGMLDNQQIWLRELEDTRVAIRREIAEVVAAIPGTDASPQDRFAYTVDHATALQTLINRAGLVRLAVSLCENGQILADAIMDSWQISMDNAVAVSGVAVAMHRTVAEAGGSPTPRDVDTLVANAESYLADAQVALQSIQDYETRVAWFVNIASILAGIGAMRIVTGFTAVQRLGTTGARIVGSLSFTATRLALTNNQGRPWTAGGVLEDAVKDYFLLRLLHGVDARIVRGLGDTGVLATSARFAGSYATLFAWALTWNALDPPVLPAGVEGASVGDIAVHTGVDLAVITIALALLRAPTIESTDLLGPDAASQTRARVRAAWESLRTELRTTGAELEAWVRGGRQDPVRGEELLRQARRQFGQTKPFYARFQEMGDITAEQAEALTAQTDAMLETIGNARVEVALGIRSVTAETWSYEGSPENVEAYLGRLQAQGRVRTVSAEPGGVFSVDLTDGARQWFFPQGRTAPVVIDLVAESMESAAPDVDASTRGAALAHLRGAGFSDVPRLVGRLDPGRSGPFVQWVARPDVGAELGRSALPQPLVEHVAGSADAVSTVEPATAHDLARWYQAFLQARPDGTPRQFLDAFRDVVAWRGQSAVSSTTLAGQLLARRGAAIGVSELDLHVYNGPSIGPIDGPSRPTDRMGAVVRALAEPGDTWTLFRRDGDPWVLQTVDGAVGRVVELSESPWSVVPVRTLHAGDQLSELRSLLTEIRTAPDEAAARAALARADVILAEIDFLLDLREGVPAADVSLMETLQHHPLRGAALVAPQVVPEDAVCDPADPLAELPPELIAVANALPADVQTALEVVAAWNATRALEILSAPLLVESMRADPGNAEIFLRSIAETRGMPLFEPHLHGAGAIRYGRRMGMDILDAPSRKGRADVTRTRVEFGDRIASILEAEGYPTAAQWGPLRTRLEALATAAGATRPADIPDALRREAELLGDEIAAVLSLGIERASEPQLARFFAMYQQVVATFTSEQIPTVAAEQAASGTGALEVRTSQGLPAEADDPVTGGTRRIYGVPGSFTTAPSKLPDGQTPQTWWLDQLARLDAQLADARVVGIDKGGQEIAGQGLGIMVDASLAITGRNFTLLSAWLQTRPNTTAALEALTGFPPLGADTLDIAAQVAQEAADRRASLADAGAALPGNVATSPVLDLAYRIRVIREALGRLNAEAPQWPGVQDELAGGLPSGMKGLTLHAGEQVTSLRTDLPSLLDDVAEAVDNGADRIGHGTVLGVRFPDDLAMLGFEAQPDGSWLRRAPDAWWRPRGGWQTRPAEQRLTAEQVADLETRRLDLLERIASLRIVVEVPPTSNVVLAGLPPLRHPVAQMLADQPDLRVVAATDNPGIHATDLPTETALLAASAGMPYGRRVVLYLEGYASRLGGGALPNAGGITDAIVASIVTNTPPGEALAVLEAVYARWPVGDAPTAADTVGPAYEAALRRLLRSIVW